jgi:peptide deformylase
MTFLPIRLIPDPVLRVNCSEVTAFDETLRRLVDDMVETMYGAPGVGLAAPQVGVEKRLAVVDVSVGRERGRLLVLINPRIVEEEGRVVDVEGCLSIPDVTEKVARPAWIKVVAQDLDGASFELEAEEFEARAICHEIDHLNGVLFIDHLHGLRKDKVRRQMKKLGLLG